MANIINYAAVFNRILDEQFYILPRTMWMENTNPGIVWNGGKEVKIPMLSTDGLGDMQNCSAPMGDINLDWETKRLQWYRGRDFSIPRYAVDETNFALTANNVLNVFMKTQVVPEIDRLRISALASAALGYNRVKAQAASGITADNILSLLLNDIAEVQDTIGENEQLYIQISTTLKNVLQQSSQITRYLNVRDYTVRGANLRIDTLNDQFLIGTPSSYMNSLVVTNDGRTEGQTVGGVEFANLGPNVNWIIAARPVVQAVARPQVTKVFSPDENQMGNCWKIMFAIYHGLWTMDNKKEGLLVSMDTNLGSLTVTSVAGTVAVGDSVITTNAKFDVSAEMKLVYKTDASTAPSVAFGTALKAADGWLDLPDGGLISTTNGYKITVALVSAKSGLPVSSGNATIVAKAS